MDILETTSVCKVTSKSTGLTAGININKWYSEELNDLRIIKDKSFETFNFIKSVFEDNNNGGNEIKHNLWNIFVQNRNNYSRKVKQTYNEFIKSEIEMYKDDPKKLWCILKELLKQKSSVPVL